MTTNIEKIEMLLEQNNGILTTKLADAHNIAHWFLTSLTRAGKLERVARGIYLSPAYSNYDERYFFQLQNATCIYSHQSALFLNNLSERIPFKEEVTVPQGYNSWRIKDKVTVHRIKPEWHKLGIKEIESELGNKIKIYNTERTLCDLIRDRKNQDPEILSKAFHLYVEKSKKNIKLLQEYARTFGILKQITNIMEIIS